MGADQSTNAKSWYDDLATLDPSYMNDYAPQSSKTITSVTAQNNANIASNANPGRKESPIDIYDRITQQQQSEQAKKYGGESFQSRLTREQEQAILARLPEEVRMRNPKIKENVKYVGSQNTFQVFKKVTTPQIKYVEKLVEVPQYQEVIIEIPGRRIPKQRDDFPQMPQQAAPTPVPAAPQAPAQQAPLPQTPAQLQEEEDDERDVVIVDRIVQVPRIEETVLAEPIIEERELIRTVDKLVTITKYVQLPDIYEDQSEDPNYMHNMNSNHPPSVPNNNNTSSNPLPANFQPEPVVMKQKRQPMVYHGGQIFDDRYIVDAQNKQALLQAGQMGPDVVLPAVHPRGPMAANHVQTIA